ncbi:uncharacterized protein EDB91DRAFT_1088774 [Suillus paluster]|uniref:uncharacterized protein n=1 Tax=Suillus paluster TaxID=48578 RepID=UPI001B86650D|nr:uncharacterized protein EDB91DRAFT_1088774 [Suillus paluster]KAG1720576.1 hypothetical protein EDB91DRAFT_1088774 [Suillus paluster]
MYSLAEYRRHLSGGISVRHALPFCELLLSLNSLSLYCSEPKSEQQVLKVYKIAESQSEVTGHVPEMVWIHKFEEASMEKSTRSLAIDDADAERGSCSLHIKVFRKLLPITKLSGNEFLSPWWQVVLGNCCFFLRPLLSMNNCDTRPLCPVEE